MGHNGRTKYKSNRHSFDTRRHDPNFSNLSRNQRRQRAMVGGGGGIRDFQVVAKLGLGAYGSVYRVRVRDACDVRACRHVRMPTESVPLSIDRSN